MFYYYINVLDQTIDLIYTKCLIFCNAFELFIVRFKTNMNYLGTCDVPIYRKNVFRLTCSNKFMKHLSYWLSAVQPYRSSLMSPDHYDEQQEVYKAYFLFTYPSANTQVILNEPGSFNDQHKVYNASFIFRNCSATTERHY